ncbi:hypothetical protein [Xanthomonas sp. WHRI 8932A]|uniref:hypothetical protein n=1 Tax=unclassified Xanthomonas TaxID=2643310 RepID=UPI002B228AFB|nr:hypothetical protein [Xanthomonas sp. WHRI 8932A]MEA9566258.1 hypothetical protein [Xanthomonas sp. WHRI 8932A]
MAAAKKSKKPYAELSDIEKIQKNWNKIRGLMQREEWSSAIVRAATATEIAANLVIREELGEGRGLPLALIDHLLRWANGIHGKFDKLILPVTKGGPIHAQVKKLKARVEDINFERNSVVHSGAFKTKTQAKKVISDSRAVIKELVDLYYDGFHLNST